MLIFCFLCGVWCGVFVFWLFGDYRLGYKYGYVDGTFDGTVVQKARSDFYAKNRR